MVYLYLAIHIDIPFYKVRVYIGYFLIFYTVGVLLTKMVLSVMIATNALNRSDNFVRSMGIIIDQERLKIADVLLTYTSDSLALFIYPFLVQHSRQVIRLEFRDYEKFCRFLKTCMNVHAYYYHLVAATVLISSITALLVPS